MCGFEEHKIIRAIGATPTKRTLESRLDISEKSVQKNAFAKERFHLLP